MSSHAAVSGQYVVAEVMSMTEIDKLLDFSMAQVLDGHDEIVDGHSRRAAYGHPNLK